MMYGKYQTRGSSVMVAAVIATVVIIIIACMSLRLTNLQIFHIILQV